MLATRMRQAAAGIAYLLRDLFATDRAAGAVNGTAAEPGAGIRTVIDVESKVTIQNDVLRFSSLTTSDWQRAGIIYGTLARVAGTVALFHLTEGDVQAGPAGVHFAAGLFASSNPANPLTGHTIGTATAGTSGGQLYVNLGTTMSTLFPSIKQPELLLFIAMRPTGVIYFVTAPTGARHVGVSGYPNMRPIGINPSGSGALYPSMFTRQDNSQILVSAIAAEVIGDWAQWYTSAHAADTLIGGDVSISGRAALVGGNWTLQAGAINVTATGAKCITSPSRAFLSPATKSGLIAATFVTGATPSSAIGYIMFRYTDVNNRWIAGFDTTQFRIFRTVAGVSTEINTSGSYKFTANSTHYVQVVDDGDRYTVFLDGVLVWTGTDTTHGNATGCGILLSNTGDLWVQNFEAHPLAVAIPNILQILTPFDQDGTTTLATENFTGASADLDGKTTTTGALTWRADTGRIDLDGGGSAARVSGAPIYTIPWSDTDFADLQVQITPPGTDYGQSEAGLCGLIFWQDAANYLLARFYITDDQVDATEIEIIYTRAGDGVVERRVSFGTEITHGQAGVLRAVCTGTKFLIHLDGEPVISSRLIDIKPSYPTLTINRVGIYAASQDTGSLFDDFVAKSA